MMKNRVEITEDLEFSRIVHGHWRLMEQGISNKDLLKLIHQIIELGITGFDHADIYGDYSCERKFGDVLNLKKGLRKDIQIITKCGINLISDKFPERQIKYYDYSKKHIIDSVVNSLKNLNTDYIDLLLLHRPAPFFNPEEAAEAFSYLKQSGKVLHFGVSNFNPQQYEMLNSYTEEKLVSNQVEISPFCLEHFENGNIDYFLKEKIKPMAWSPLAGGKILNPKEEKAKRIFKTLSEIAEELNVHPIDKIIYVWLLKHPVSIIPIVGSFKIERIKYAADALNIDMDLEQWYRIYTASTSMELP